jgi:hypothetical protein
MKFQTWKWASGMAVSEAPATITLSCYSYGDNYAPVLATAKMQQTASLLTALQVQ